MTPEASLALLALSEEVTDRWREQLAEPQRHYHGLRHITAMLAAIPDGRASRELVAAVWLHDVIYDPRADDNEEQSAEQARHDLAGSDVDAERVATLILGTKHHRSDTDEGRLLNDLDLGILGSSGCDYRRYASDIRREYAHVPDEAYRAGRAQVLRSFLDAPAIFASADFEHLDRLARANLAAEIAALNGDR